MLLVRILLGLLLGYAVLVFLAWAFQERIAFPAPRGAVPDPRQVGAANGERIELMMRDGTKLAGWYLTPRGPAGDRPGRDRGGRARPRVPLHERPGHRARALRTVPALHRAAAARQPRQPASGPLPRAGVPRHGRPARAPRHGAPRRRGRSRGPGRAGLDPGRRAQRHLRPRWGSLPSQAVAVRAGRRAGQMTLTGTIRSGPRSKPRSAASSGRSTGGS